MSAIYGIINKNGASVEPGVLLKMKQAIMHRAKDGSGEAVYDNAGFGFCQLLVYPNQENEKLPLETSDHLFTANAHLHNRDELIGRLGVDKKQYDHIPDSYLLFEAYKKWGERCVHYLDGEYVYAVWNKNSKQLFISTDHIGFKPVFYYDSPTQLIFCSEIKGIEAVKETENYFGENSLIQYFFLYSSQPGSTFNKEIKFLGGGTNLKWPGGDAVLLEKYWEAVPGKYHFKNDADWYGCLEEKISRSASDRLSSGARIGIGLSGGLDSAAIACILSQVLKQKNQPLYAFSSVLPLNYSGNAKDEREYIGLLNTHCGNIIQEYVTAENTGPYDGIEQAFERDEMFPNYFHYMDTALLRAASSKSVRILYTGYGGDFWVSAQGNGVIYKMLNRFRFAEGFRLLKLMAETYGNSVWSTFKMHYVPHTALYKKYQRSKWDFRRYFRDGYPDRSAINEMAHDVSFMPRFVNEGLIGRLAGLFDNRNASAGMASAAPFFDKNIAELMCDMPPRLFIEGGYKRNLFRSALKNVLPLEIRLRKDKTPFVPDYRERIRTVGYAFYERLLEAEKEPVGKIFHSEKLKELLRKITMDDRAVKDIELLRACQVVCSILIIRHLRSKKYSFGFLINP